MTSDLKKDIAMLNHIKERVTQATGSCPSPVTVWWVHWSTPGEKTILSEKHMTWLTEFQNQFKTHSDTTRTDHTDIESRDFSSDNKPHNFWRSEGRIGSIQRKEGFRIYGVVHLPGNEGYLVWMVKTEIVCETELLKHVRDKTPWTRYTPELMTTHRDDDAKLSVVEYVCLGSFSTSDSKEKKSKKYQQLQE